jgi:hypothetical protein
MEVIRPKIHSLTSVETSNLVKEDKILYSILLYVCEQSVYQIPDACLE